MIQQALISVSDKTNIVEFAQALAARGIRILSTGGTAKILSAQGIAVTEVASYTGFPEMLEGRVKTLHPKIHGGILARRDSSTHQAALAQHNIPTIDMVIVNLYPFENTINQPDCKWEDAIENIDIGGPAMLRSAAKNHQDVVVVCDPTDYPMVLKELDTQHISSSTRRQLAQKVFAHTGHYDTMIANYFQEIANSQLTSTNPTASPENNSYPNNLSLHFQKIQDLRYGENPHQTAAFYRDTTYRFGIATAIQLQGKELSYNNIADADAAWECVKTFLPYTNPLTEKPAIQTSQIATCVIIKHANPCGVATAETTVAAYQKAFQTDPTSAFGGIIACNHEVDEQAATAIATQFVEVLIAPAFSTAARQIFANKPNVRLLQVDLPLPDTLSGSSKIAPLDYKKVGGGLLVQSLDNKNIQVPNLQVVTRLRPNAQQLQNLLFAWRVAKFVKSNAIVFCANNMTLGIGAGQMSRIDSAKIATIKSQQANLSLVDSAVASDAFFPFRDGLDVVIDAGASCVIQPGGSMRDAEVISAADERGIVMVLTGTRHFRH